MVSSPTIASTTAEISSLHLTSDNSAILYIDLEGQNLSRYGTLELITLLSYPDEASTILDVQLLGHRAFNTPTGNGRTLKSILEDSTVRKRVWDIRNDAGALWSLFNVKIAGVTDVQLLENASRTGSKQWVHGLDKSVQADAGLRWQEKERFLRIKRDIVAQMNNDIFSVRPLSEKVVTYCVNDVKHLPKLFDVYHRRLASQSFWLTRVEEESQKRIQQACSPSYDPNAPSKREGPWRSETQPSRGFDDYYEDDGLGFWNSAEDDWDDGWCNAADGALFPEYLDSCWDRGS